MEERPDLILSVEHHEAEGRPRLIYRLDDGNAETRAEQRLDKNPAIHLEELLSDLEEILVDDPSDEVRNAFKRRIAGLGARLAERLLPPELLQSLLAYHDPARSEDETAPTLLVVSDDPWIPWEFLRLRDPRGGDDGGVFLGEAFALTRWLWDVAATLALPCEHLGLVVADAKGSLPHVGGERRDVCGYGGSDLRQVEEVPARYNALLDGFASGRFSAWHFIGHGVTEGENPDLWDLLLDGEDTLGSSDLSTVGSAFAARRPMVFLNACRSARLKPALSGLGGPATAFLEAGAGAGVGTHWSVEDARARDFTRAFYELFLGQGEPIGEAARQARLWLRDTYPGDPTWLAYTAFAHPRAAADGDDRPLPPQRRPEPHLEIPRREWLPDRSPPGALLRADHGVVPFHGREDELGQLLEWCQDEKPVRVRLFTGAGGMGKTRLAIELCHRQRAAGWRTGFVPYEADAAPLDVARGLVEARGPLLAVIDYAETRRDFLLAVLKELLETRKPGPFRFILLARAREEWWEQLKNEPGHVGDLLAGPATSHRVLTPLANATEARAATYRMAAEAFAGKLERPIPEGRPDDLDADYFKPVLLLHMSALGAVEGVPLKGEDGILDWVLDREKRFWKAQATSRELAKSLMPGIGRTMAAVTLAGGSPSEPDALELLEALKFFRGQTHDVLTNVARLLHDIYPGEPQPWIAPVQPDILGEHLVERELTDDPQEIFDLVLGEQSQGAEAAGAEA